RLPRSPLGRELIGAGLHVRGINAAEADRLAVRRDAGLDDIVEPRAIDLRLPVRRDAADHCDVVVEAEMANAVILWQQRAGFDESVGEVRGACRRPERRVVALILE